MDKDTQLNFDIARTEQYPEDHQERIAEWMRDELANQCDQAEHEAESVILRAKSLAWETVRIAYAMRRQGHAQQSLPL